MKRNRVAYCAILLVVIVVGLATRKYPSLFPPFIAKYGGDTLWALAGFLIVGIICPRLPTGKAAAIALAFGYAIEVSQLYQAPWINWLRHVTYGLILGWEFGWSDLVCYTVGVGLGVLAEMVWRKKGERGADHRCAAVPAPRSSHPPDAGTRVEGGERGADAPRSPVFSKISSFSMQRTATLAHK